MSRAFPENNNAHGSVHLTILNLCAFPKDKVKRHSLLLTRHAAYKYRGWCNTCDIIQTILDKAGASDFDWERDSVIKRM